MSDQNREHRPLLCDDYSDEEFHVRSNKFQRRNRISFCNGRARINAKGAAAVIARWPDNYCSTTLAYWWFGLIMFTVTIFVIYNCVQIFGMIPAPTFRPPQYRTFNNVINSKPQLPVPVDVFMHLILNNDTDINLNKHLQHANIFASKYPSLKFTFLVLINDTSHDVFDFNDNERKEIALNYLWTSKMNDRQRYRKYNISVEYVSLTAFFNASPVKKFWRHLPQYLVEFLVRSISIWDKGGIAFSPLILTPISPNTEYIKNVHILLQKFEKPCNDVEKIKTTTERSVKVNIRRPNNIRDIINALDKESNNISYVDLNVADNNEIANVVNVNDTYLSKLNTPTMSSSINTSQNKLNEKPYVFKPMTNTVSNDNRLPLFLKYIFKNTHKNDSTNNESDTNLSKETQNSSILLNVMNSEEVKVVPPNKVKRNGSEQYDHLIISKSREFENDQELTLDIKGNIIASKSACHAFLGTIFSNVIHHTEEKTLTDFIITELSLFCNGLFTSCVGINVILV